MQQGYNLNKKKMLSFSSSISTLHHLQAYSLEETSCPLPLVFGEQPHASHSLLLLIQLQGPGLTPGTLQLGG